MRRWIVREREAERDRAIVLTVDNAVEDPSDPAALERFERTISRCAGQALVLLSRGGEVGFQARGVRVVPHAGRAQRARVLEALARLSAVAAEGAPAFPLLRRGDHRVMVS